MRRIKVLTEGLSTTELAATKALAAEADFAVDETELVDSVGEPDSQCDDEMILILMTPAICASPILESALVAAQRGSRRAVLVWPKGAGPVEPPAAAKKYAYSIIRHDADKLRVVAADDDELCFEKANGAPLAKPEMERNLCVEEKATPA
jgi:hypothetical protein